MKNNLLLIVGFILALMLLSLLGWGWMYLTAEFKGRAEAERQIESAGSRIANYEHFYDLCATIQGNEASLAAQRAAMAGAPADEQARYRANIAGIEAQRRRNIARYNQDANKSYTRARFLGEDLPRRINANQENTVCAN